MVRQFDHGFEDRADSLSSDLVRQRCGVQGAGVVAGVPGTLGELCQEGPGSSWGWLMIWRLRKQSFGARLPSMSTKLANLCGLLVGEQ